MKFAFNVPTTGNWNDPAKDLSIGKVQQMRIVRFFYIAMVHVIDEHLELVRVIGLGVGGQDLLLWSSSFSS